MFPWENPHVRTTPVHQASRRTRTPENQTSEGVIDVFPVNQPFQIDSTQLQSLLSRGIATALAVYKAAQNESSEHSAKHSSNPSLNPDKPRTFSYTDLLACEPINFHGTEGMIGLSKWIEKMETVFRVSSCPYNWQVRYATCTLKDAALAWWINHATSVGFDVAYCIDWEALQQMMIMEYCPRQEIQTLEREFSDLTMKGSEATTYTYRFSKLASLCPGMVNPESKKIDRYIRGLVPSIQVLVAAFRPTTFDVAKKLAYQWTEQCIRQGTMAPQTERNQKESTKRKSDSESEENSKHHKPEPEPVAVHATIANPLTTSKSYKGKAPLCTRCNFHHTGNCMSCDNCSGRGHTYKFCKKYPASATTTTTHTAGEVRTCFACHLLGHYRKDCPTLRT